MYTWIKYSLATFLAFTCLIATAKKTAPELHTQQTRTLSEAEVLRKIHLTNQMEIRAGELAQQKGYTQQTRDFGKRLCVDHASADARVLQVSRDLGIEVTRPIAGIDEKFNTEESALMKKLNSTVGLDFDRYFGDAMHSGHEDTIRFLKETKMHLKGTRTAGLIDELLPTLATHEHMAESLEKLAE